MRRKREREREREREKQKRIMMERVKGLFCSAPCSTRFPNNIACCSAFFATRSPRASAHLFGIRIELVQSHIHPVFGDRHRAGGHSPTPTTFAMADAAYKLHIRLIEIAPVTAGAARHLTNASAQLPKHIEFRPPPPHIALGKTSGQLTIRTEHALTSLPHKSGVEHLPGTTVDTSKTATPTLSTPRKPNGRKYTLRLPRAWPEQQATSTNISGGSARGACSGPLPG